MATTINDQPSSYPGGAAYLPPAFREHGALPDNNPRQQGCVYTVLNAIDGFLDIGGAMEALQRSRARYDQEGSGDGTMRLAIAISYVASLIFQGIQFASHFFVALRHKVEGFMQYHGLQMIAPAHVVLGAAVCGILTSGLTFLYELKHITQLSLFLRIFEKTEYKPLKDQYALISKQLNKIANLGHAKLEHRLQPWFVKEKLLSQNSPLPLTEPNINTENLELPNRLQLLATQLLSNNPAEQTATEAAHQLAIKVLSEMRLQATKKLCVHILGIIGCGLALASTAVFLTAGMPIALPLILTLVSTAFYIAQYVARAGLLDNKEGGFSALKALPEFLQRGIQSLSNCCRERRVHLA